MDSDDDDLNGLLPPNSTKRVNTNTMRIQKLRNITGRTDSITALQDYLVPENLDDAMKNRNAIEASDRLKKKLGERPPASASRPSMTSSSPTTASPGRRASVNQERRASVELGRRNSGESKVVKRKNSLVNSTLPSVKRDSKEMREEEGEDMKEDVKEATA